MNEESFILARDSCIFVKLFIISPMLIFLDLANFTVAPPPFKLDQGYVAFFFMSR